MERLTIQLTNGIEYTQEWKGTEEDPSRVPAFESWLYGTTPNGYVLNNYNYEGKFEQGTGSRTIPRQSVFMYTVEKEPNE